MDVEFVNSVMERYSPNSSFWIKWVGLHVEHLLLIGLCMWLNKTRNEPVQIGVTCWLTCVVLTKCAFACCVKGCVCEVFVCWETSGSGGCKKLSDSGRIPMVSTTFPFPSLMSFSNFSLSSFARDF